MTKQVTRCPVCDNAFGSREAMQQHFNDTHRSGGVALTDQVPDSTIDGSLPDRRCENCRFWGKANNLTVCRRTKGVPALVGMAGGGQTCIALYTPALANEWCGDWEALSARDAARPPGILPLS